MAAPPNAPSCRPWRCGRRCSLDAVIRKQGGFAMRVPKWSSVLGSVLLSSALLLGCGTTVVNPVTGREERTVMDEAAEIAAGRKAHQQVLAEYGVYRRPRAAGLCRTASARSWRGCRTAPACRGPSPCSTAPRSTPSRCPAATSTSRAASMAYLDSEAELAGVIGHEIGHVTARHGAQRATRQQTPASACWPPRCWARCSKARASPAPPSMAGQLSQGVAAGCARHLQPRAGAAGRPAGRRVPGAQPLRPAATWSTSSAC